MNDEFTKIEKIALVALQGLLASGHYTEIQKEDGSEIESPELKRLDHGPDWKVDGAPTRMMSHAASDAFIVARDFVNESEFWKDKEPK